MIDIEAAIESRVDNKGVCHGDSLWLHGMFFGVNELAEVLVVKV